MKLCNAHIVIAIIMMSISAVKTEVCDTAVCMWAGASEESELKSFTQKMKIDNIADGSYAAIGNEGKSNVLLNKEECS